MGMPAGYPADVQLQQFAIHWGMVEADEKHKLLLRSIGAKNELRVDL